MNSAISVTMRVRHTVNDLWLKSVKTIDARSWMTSFLKCWYFWKEDDKYVHLLEKNKCFYCLFFPANPISALCFSPSRGGISTWPSSETAPITWTSTKTRRSPKSPKEPFSWTPAWVWFRYVDTLLTSLVTCNPQCQTGCPVWCCGSPGCGLVPCGN